MEYELISPQFIPGVPSTCSLLAEDANAQLQKYPSTQGYVLPLNSAPSDAQSTRAYKMAEKLLISGRFLPDNCADSDPLKELELWSVRDDYIDPSDGKEPSGSEPSVSHLSPQEERRMDPILQKAVSYSEMCKGHDREGFTGSDDDLKEHWSRLQIAEHAEQEQRIPEDLRCQTEDKTAIRSLLLHALRVAANLDPGTGNALSSRSIVTLPNESRSSSSEDLTVGLAPGYSVKRDDKGVPIYTKEYDDLRRPIFSTDPDSYVRPPVTSENPVMKVVTAAQIKAVEAEGLSSSEASLAMHEVPRMGIQSSSSRNSVRGVFAEKSSNPLLNPIPSKEHDFDGPQSLLADGVVDKVQRAGQPQPRIPAKRTSVSLPAPPVKEGMSVPQSGSGPTNPSHWWSPDQRPAPSVPERVAAFGANALQTCWRPSAPAHALQTVWRPSVPARAAAVPSGAPPPYWTGQWTGKGSWKGQQNW